MKTFTKILSATFTFGLTALMAQSVPFIGNGTIGYSGDGGPATSAQLKYISSFCGDAAGNIFVSDFGNADVRKVNTSSIISTVAGNQIQGFSGDGGLATSASFSVNGGFGAPENMDIAKDAAGNLYVNDFKNFRIRKVTAAGIISTLAGTGLAGYTGDGGLATLAKIKAVNLTCDATGNVYFSDATNNVVRKISTSGIITTVAGTGISGFSGDGSLGDVAKINTPGSLVIDASGNLFFSDRGNNRIRKVNTSGIISTYGGNGLSSYSGDGGLATSAAICPTSLAISPVTGNLIVVSMSHQTSLSDLNGKCNIRSISLAGVITTVRDSSYFLMGGSQYVQNMRSIYVDGSASLYFSPDYNICVGFCDPGTCYKTSLASSSTGIEALDFDNKMVNVYPNPSNGNFNVESTLIENGTIEVFDIAGKLVHTQPLNGSLNAMSLNLSPGNYNVSIKANGVTINKKIVITK